MTDERQRESHKIVQSPVDKETDHVHLLVEYPPKVSISKLVNSLKGVPLRLLRKQNYPSIQKALWGKVSGLRAILQELVEGHL